MRKPWVTKFWAGLIVLSLLLVFCDVKLARPAAAGPIEDQWIGFHLVYEATTPLEDGEWQIGADRNNDQWVEYGSWSTKVDGIGSVSIPKMILIGQRQEDGHYLFPGLDGYNALLDQQKLSEEEGTTASSIGFCSDLAHSSTDVKQTDSGTEISFSGTLYYGPPLDESNWNTDHSDYVWTAYDVYQMEDGTVYLTGDGNSYGGVGGFSFTKKIEWSEQFNKKETRKQSLELEISIQSIPRTTSVSLMQLSAEGEILDETTITDAQIGKPLPPVPRMDGTACVLMRQNFLHDPPSFSLLEQSESGFSGSVFFLDEDGQSIPIHFQVGSSM